MYMVSNTCSFRMLCILCPYTYIHRYIYIYVILWVAFSTWVGFFLADQSPWKINTTLHWFPTQVAKKVAGKRPNRLGKFSLCGFAGCKNNVWWENRGTVDEAIYRSWDCNSNFTSYPSGDTCFRNPFSELGIAIPFHTIYILGIDAL